MSTNHTGDPNLAQAPSGPPYEEDPPVRQLPSDGDALTAASVAQALGNPADWEAFEQAPFANPTDSNQVIKTYRNARLLTRTVHDHLGYRTGQTTEIEEDWLDVGKVLKNAIGNGAWSGRWLYSLSGPFAGTVQVVGAGDVGLGIYSPRTPALKLATGGGGVTPNAASVEMPFGLAIGDDDGDLTMEWQFVVTSGVNNAMGFTAATQQGVVTEFVAQTVAGAAALVTRTGHANFQLYTSDYPGGANHVDDTGIAVDGNMHHARLELRGANTSDDSTARVRLYLDNSATPVVDRAILVGGPSGGTAAQLRPFFKVVATNSINPLWIGRTRFRGNTEVGDVVY